MSLFSRKPCSACAAKDAEIAFLRQFVGGARTIIRETQVPGVAEVGANGHVPLPVEVATSRVELAIPGMNEVFGRNTTSWEDVPDFSHVNGSGPVGEDRAE